MDEVFLTTNELMWAFDIMSPATLTKWKDLGATEAYDSRNRWNLKLFIDWYLSTMLDRNTDESSDLRAAKLEYWRAKGELERIKADKEKELLIPKDDVFKSWAWRIAEVKRGLEALAHRLPGPLEGKTQTEMREIIKEEVWHLLDNYSRNGKFCPKDEKIQQIVDDFKNNNLNSKE